jgi:hypothetical protein
MVLLPSQRTCATALAPRMELPSTRGLALVSLATSPAGPSSRTTASPTPPPPPEPPTPPIQPTAQPAPGPHGMWTHAKGGLKVPPTKRLNLSVTHTTTLSLIPKSYRATLEDPNWLATMQDEYHALVAIKTWSLIPRPSTANLISGKWVFKHKFHSDGTLSRYNAHWVTRGYSQQPNIDYNETFSLVVKLAMIRTVLSIVVSHSWPIYQLDVKSAFLNESLDETVYCAQPSGFADPEHPTHVCKLHKSLYGLKQARAPGTSGLRHTPVPWVSRHQPLTHRCSSSVMASTHATSSSTSTTSSSLRHLMPCWPDYYDNFMMSSP